MTWPHSIDEGPDQKLINQSLRATADTMPIEEVSKPDPDSTREAQGAETTRTGTTNTDTSANSKATDRRNARRESKKINLAVTPKDKHIGPGSTSWRKIKMLNPSKQSTTQRTKFWKMTMTIVST